MCVAVSLMKVGSHNEALWHFNYYTLVINITLKLFFDQVCAECKNVITLLPRFI